MVRDVSKYLRTKEEGAANNPELANQWAELNDLYSKRLWHQLTIKLSLFVKTPEFQLNQQLLDLYENFIQDVEMRINALALMEMLALVVRQIDDVDQALEFLTKTEPKLKGQDVALALCWITKGEIALEKNKPVSEVKTMMEEAEKMLIEIDGVSPAHGRFYLLQSRLFKKSNDTSQYYKSALKFLGCTKLSDLTLADQRDHARNLAIAALVGDGIYNFGELLAHPVLNSLNRTPEAWLIEILKAFNEGNIPSFNQLKKQAFHQPDLKKHETLLQTKILLLGLMEMTFKRPATMRQLTFEEIAQVLGIPEDQVESIVMKAIAKGLVNGTIDEIDRKVHMTWVQPRVLNPTQIGRMIERLDDWKKEIKHVEKLMVDSAHEILLT